MSLDRLISVSALAGELVWPFVVLVISTVAIVLLRPALLALIPYLTELRVAGTEAHFLRAKADPGIANADTSGTAGPVNGDKERRSLRESIERLSEIERESLYLYFREHMRLEDIAAHQERPFLLVLEGLVDSLRRMRQAWTHELGTATFSGV